MISATSGYRLIDQIGKKVKKKIKFDFTLRYQT